MTNNRDRHNKLTSWYEESAEIKREAWEKLQPREKRTAPRKKANRDPYWIASAFLIVLCLLLYALRR